MSIQTGRHKEYYWLQTQSLSPRMVLDKCARFVVDKYLAITATDSGRPSISPEEIDAGWRMKDGKALSEFEIDQIPDYGFDEWYFF